MALVLRTVIGLLRRVSPLPDGALLVGAWVPSLYGAARGSESVPVATRDVDFALSTTPGNRKVHREWVDSLPSRLGDSLYQLRFEGTSHGATPFTVLGPIEDVANLPDIEVITGLRGGGRKPPELRRWFSGQFVPQEVRRLELLFAAPWSIELPGGGATIAVPNPLAFVCQKALVGRRTDDKRISDATDILETAIRVVDTSRLEGLREGIERHSKRAGKQMNAGLGRLNRKFLSPGSTVLSRAIDGLPRALPERDAVTALRRFLTLCGVEP